ncbi:MAG: MBL fold metallo-hydrolase [Thiobacillaceae bacterium]
MRFASLGSGSRGNAWLVDSGSVLVMLDCGFGLREISKRLERRGVTVDAVSALVITHEHADHARGAARFAARHGCSVWLTHGCLTMLTAMGVAPDRVQVVDSHTPFVIGDLQIRPFPVPHDAREPVQYTVTDGNVRLGVLTDAGHVTEHMVQCLDGCHALVLECNHDLDMLRQGGYPPGLKARIQGRYGHLDNQAAAGLLGRVDRSKLQHVVAAHLSEENNTPEMARTALAEALGCEPDEIGVADQNEGLDWRDIV